MASNGVRTNGSHSLIDPKVFKKLDPEFVEYFDRVLASRTATHKVPIEELRANPDKYANPWCRNVDGYERVYDHSVPISSTETIPVKVYYPDPARYGPGPYGVLVNYHGGGYVFGDLTTDSIICLDIQENVGIVVVDVNYRHCPEVKWGVGAEDAWSALQWVRASSKSLNIDPDSVSIAGISAGAVFCSILQHRARDEGINLKLAIIAVPSTTSRLCYTDSYDRSPFPSFIEFAKAPCLDWDRMKFFARTAYGDMAEVLSRCPAWWPDQLSAPNFHNLCETHILVAECDPLRDEGEAYGMKCVAAGNKVTMKRYLGMPHPFMYFKELTQAKAYQNDINEALKIAHATCIQKIT